MSKESTQDTDSEAGPLRVALGDTVTCVITIFKIGFFISSNNCVILFVYYIVFKCRVLLIFAVVAQLLSHVQLFVTPWTAARQAPLSYLKFNSVFSYEVSQLS